MSIINQKIIQFARIWNKKHVRVWAKGNFKAAGECWDLAYQGLKKAGAMTPHDLDLGIYVWSSKIVSLEKAIPGDIIQYKEYKYESKRVNTSGKKEGYTYTETVEIGLPNHTAILKAKKENGQVEVYEQNMGNKKTVHTNTYYLVAGEYESLNKKITVTVLGGKYTIYRPLKKVKKAAIHHSEEGALSFNTWGNGQFEEELPANIFV